MELINKMIETIKSDIEVLENNLEMVNDSNIIKSMQNGAFMTYGNYISFCLGEEALNEYLKYAENKVIKKLKSSSVLSNYSFLVNDNIIKVSSSGCDLAYYNYLENIAWPTDNAELKKLNLEIENLENEITNLSYEIQAMEQTLEQFFNLIKTKNISKAKLEELKNRKNSLETDVIYKKNRITAATIDNKMLDREKVKILNAMKTRFGINIKYGDLKRE